jgi:drug/metabolite transporter (DMT)-like permease
MTRRALLLFIAMSVIWGLPYLFIRIAVSDLSPVVLVFVRTALGALILLPVALARGEVRGMMKSWLPLVVFTAVEIAIPWFMISSAEQKISSSLAGLLVAAVPLVGLVIAVTLGHRQSFGLTSLAGLVLGVVGVAAIVGFDLRASGWMPLAEMALVVICYAGGPAILSRHLSEEPAVGVNAVALTLCALAYAPLAAVQWPHALPPADAIVAVIVLAVVCTALGFLLFFALIAEMGPVRATVITYVNPAVAAVLGVVVLHENFTPGMAIGFVLVLAGSVLATRRPAVAVPV